MAFIQLTLNVFYHHDRIIHHDPDREDKSKQGQRINTETNDQQRTKGAHDRHGDRNERYQRRSPILQEQENHQRD